MACAQYLGCVPLFVTPWTVAHQAPLSMGFSRQEYWSGLCTLLQGVFLTRGWNSCLYLLHWGSLPLVPPGESPSPALLLPEIWSSPGPQVSSAEVPGLGERRPWGAGPQSERREFCMTMRALSNSLDWSISKSNFTRISLGLLRVIH